MQLTLISCSVLVGLAAIGLATATLLVVGRIELALGAYASGHETGDASAADTIRAACTQSGSYMPIRRR